MKPVANYIPHQPPMRLIGELLSVEEYQVVVDARVSTDNVFFSADAGGVPTWVGIEYMAQAAAVWVGLHCERRGRPIAPAFLLSSR
ncbi:MAG TPA: 3-hydroxylacyl-ACP dehydratase, partial [Marinobacter sp.]|nr:3-hydroxylacyl-ACP dehydratase [Marinobacter sp.]